ncbi:MAG TPA: hypothetical protein VE174_11780 [Actinomycetota bacterium]|nr:hypothetical protein [Actinomycetota bacterium]
MIVKLGAGIAALFLLVSCGGGDNGTAPAAGGGDGAGDMTLTIESPADGDEVSTPFTLEFGSSEELGPTETGAFHVHVYYDGNEEEYEVVQASTFEVTDLPPGSHEIYASLRNADHSETGVEAQVVEVTVGGSGGGTDEKSDTGGGGYDY